MALGTIGNLGTLETLRALETLKSLETLESLRPPLPAQSAARGCALVAESEENEIQKMKNYLAVIE